MIESEVYFFILNVTGLLSEANLYKSDLFSVSVFEPKKLNSDFPGSPGEVAFFNK
jgi:hypothetical protein